MVRWQEPTALFADTSSAPLYEILVISATMLFRLGPHRAATAGRLSGRRGTTYRGGVHSIGLFGAGCKRLNQHILGQTAKLQQQLQNLGHYIFLVNERLECSTSTFSTIHDINKIRSIFLYPLSPPWRVNTIMHMLASYLRGKRNVALSEIQISPRHRHFQPLIRTFRGGPLGRQ